MFSKISDAEEHCRAMAENSGAKWKGDGWTKVCPSCGKQLGGNR